MKKVLILLSISSLLILTSCVNKQENNVGNNIDNNAKIENNLQTNQETMTEKQGPAKAGDNVEVHYKGTLEDGTQFDSSYDRGQTLPFTLGAGQMIKGFDDAVVGMKVGEKKTVTLEPSEAYGEYDETKKQVVAKKDLESFKNAGFKLEVGEKLPTQVGELEIIEADDENVTLNLNHPLAGKKLIFEIELVKIK